MKTDKTEHGTNALLRDHIIGRIKLEIGKKSTKLITISN